MISYFEFNKINIIDKISKQTYSSNRYIYTLSLQYTQPHDDMRSIQLTYTDIYIHIFISIAIHRPIFVDTYNVKF